MFRVFLGAGQYWAGWAEVDFEPVGFKSVGEKRHSVALPRKQAVWVVHQARLLGANCWIVPA
jgi:hypothetical protein